MLNLTGKIETFGRGGAVVQASIWNIVTSREEQQLKKMLRRIQESYNGKCRVNVKVTVEVDDELLEKHIVGFRDGKPIIDALGLNVERRMGK